MRKVAIGCLTIEDEINAAISILPEPERCPVVWIESGLHNCPQKLNDRIQAEINKIQDADQIILLFGFCGNSLGGAKSSSAQLIVPMVDDCISLLLGGNRPRLELGLKNKSYYLTGGWLRHENSIYHQYLRCQKKYGRLKALSIFKYMMGNYSTLHFIDTGTYCLEEAMGRTSKLAADLDLEQIVSLGSTNLIVKALSGEWEEEFLKVPPGKPIDINSMFP